MARPDFPDTMQDARSVRAGIILAVMDLIMLVIVFVWVLFVCGGGAWPGLADADTALTAFHLAHLALGLPALLLFAMPVLFLPVWFAAIGLFVFYLDVFVIVSRLALLGATTNLFCTLFLMLFDGVFLLLAAMYLGFAASAISRFGLFGSRDAVRNPHTFPVAAAAATTSSSAAAAAGVPSVYVDDAGRAKGDLSF